MNSAETQVPCDVTMTEDQLMEAWREIAAMFRQADELVAAGIIPPAALEVTW